MVEGTEAYGLLKEFDYVEEEFFLSGQANVYGPESPEPAQQVETSEALSFAVKPLSRVCRSAAPYKTRALLIRSRDPGRFSGVVHAVPFHNLGGRSLVERHLLRRGDAWVGVEVCDGTRFGPEETPSGGIANLHRFNSQRYGELLITGGELAEWGLLTPGALGQVFKLGLNFGRTGPGHQVFLQELSRSYAQGPDIFFDVVRGLRSGGETVLPGCVVRHVYTSGASGGSMILQPLIEYHHDSNLLADGRPLINGYLIRVGVVPANRPHGAVLVIFQSEAEALTSVGHGWDLPDDTDDPRFRYYELPGTGHMISASPQDNHLSDQLPPGIEGLSARDVSTEFQPYDKYNEPIVWAVWEAMYRWVEDGVPMPRMARITRDPTSPDGIARDDHGNAQGGLRTPWVDVPDARYIARISDGNPLRAGMKAFTDEEMGALYGTRQEYERRVMVKLDEMVDQRLLLPQDRSVMFPPG
jgi:hypothetical protein